MAIAKVAWSPPKADRFRFAALLSLSAVAAFVFLLAALHILEPELDPSWHFISEYELGEYGWLMRLAFISLGVSCVSLGVALFPHLNGVSGYLGLLLLLLSATGMTIAGIFLTDPLNGLRTAHGGLHETGAMLDQLPFAALLINWRLSRNEGWSSRRWLLASTAVLPLLGLAIFIASLSVMLPRNGGHVGPETLVGWPNRIMILAQCAWLISLAWCIRHQPQIGASSPHAAR
jgi:hypothetical protein